MSHSSAIQKDFSSERFVVALAGNPNSGKTTLFNHLTGLRYKVANYPGVTVERKEGEILLEEGSSSILIDLPGTYSLSGDSLDEKVAHDALQGSIDAIIVVTDASNLERNLLLVSELIDLGKPLILALNMMDRARSLGVNVRTELLSRELGIPVVPISAQKLEGIDSLRATIYSTLVEAKVSDKQFAWKNFEGLDEITLRYKWIRSICERSVGGNLEEGVSRTDRIDAVLTHRVYGLVIFALLMGFIFQAIFTWSTYPMDMIDSAVSFIGSFLNSILPDGKIRSLVVDGIVAGVGSVLVFIPQIAILFFLIGLLEQSGYLSRAAFVMDRAMRSVGLQGRSFIPLLSSFGCAIPGIMAARTIPSKADRLLTILVAPLMSCSARVPVYTVLIAAFIPKQLLLGFVSLQGFVMLSLYVLGIVGAAFSAFILRKMIFKGAPAYFLMEMPPYRLPSIKHVGREVLDRIWLFTRDAGTVILACSIVLWFLATHPSLPDGNNPPVKQSYAGELGQIIEPVIKPLGFNWEIGIGLIGSFAAREVFVSSLATVYNLDSEDGGAKSLTNHLKERKGIAGGFSLATALSLLVFYVFACQCMATLAICRKETGSWTWPILMFVYMFVLAYVGSFFTYKLFNLW